MVVGKLLVNLNIKGIQIRHRFLMPFFPNIAKPFEQTVNFAGRLASAREDILFLDVVLLLVQLSKSDKNRNHRASGKAWIEDLSYIQVPLVFIL